MAKLTAANRASLPSSDFAVPTRAPKSGSYPIPDKSHAKAALSMVSRFGSGSQKAAVKSKVKSKFPDMESGDTSTSTSTSTKPSRPPKG